MNLSDSVLAKTRPPRPDRERLRNAKIVAHRGNTGLGLKENTLAAFTNAHEIGTWGVEFDVRWTSCSTPVIHHDRNCKRVHGVDLDIDRVSFKDLRKHVPAVPAFQELISKFGGALHLMIELKSDLKSMTRAQWTQLKEMLKSLEAGRDFHLMSMDYNTLRGNPEFPHEACVPIAEFNAVRLSQQALADRMAGISGQYLLISSQVIKNHHQAGQVAGTGFVGSEAVFYREINRGVDWFFSDRAAHLLSVKRELKHFETAS